LPISKLPNFKKKCLPQNCLRQGKIPKSAYLKYFQTQLKSAYIQILHCSRLPSSRVYCNLLINFLKKSPIQSPMSNNMKLPEETIRIEMSKVMQLILIKIYPPDVCDEQQKQFKCWPWNQIFTESSHHQTYQNYEQPPQKISIQIFFLT